jgi:hypothetical protein
VVNTRNHWRIILRNFDIINHDPFLDVDKERVLPSSTSKVQKRDFLFSQTYFGAITENFGCIATTAKCYREFSSNVILRNVTAILQ